MTIEIIVFAAFLLTALCYIISTRVIQIENPLLFLLTLGGFALTFETVFVADSSLEQKVFAGVSAFAALGAVITTVWSFIAFSRYDTTS